MSNRSKAALYTLLVLGGCVTFMAIMVKYPMVIMKLLVIGLFAFAASGLYFSILRSIEFKEKNKNQNI